MRVEEVHGLIQRLADDLEGPPAAEQQIYVPLRAEPFWYFREDLLEAEASGLRNNKYLDKHDFTRTKLQLDGLYLQGKYREGLELARASYLYHGETTDVKRELVDLMGRFAIRCQDVGTMDECLRWLKQHCSVSDTGIYLLMVDIARCKGDKEGLREASEAYLKIRPGEPSIVALLDSLS
jgi:hypothetical protein